MKLWYTLLPKTILLSIQETTLNIKLLEGHTWFFQTIPCSERCLRHLHWKNGTEDRYTWCVQIHTLATGGKSGAKNIHIDIYIYMWKYILTIMSVCTCMFLCILVYLLWTNIKMIEFNELFLTVWQLSITQMVLSFQSCSLVSPSTSNDSYHLLI